MTAAPKKIELRVPAGVGRMLQPDTPFELRLAVARGTLPLVGKDLAIALLFFIHGRDTTLRAAAEQTLRELPLSLLTPVVSSRETHPRILDLVARYRFHQPEMMGPLLTNPATEDATLISLAGRAEGEVLEMLAHNDRRLLACPELRQALLENPRLAKTDRYRLAEKVPAEPAAGEPETEGQDAAQLLAEAEQQLEAGELAEGEYDQLDSASKFQMLQGMPIAEKIKMALTGDSEWRSLLVKEPNRMISAAVIKNPRITDKEIFNIAQNRSSHEELIRLILLNRDWTQNYEIRKALVYHPRTPLQKAMRFMGYLTEKDIRLLAKSRAVAQPIVNNARRLLFNKKR